MATDLVRRCDVCGRLIPDSRPVVLLVATVYGTTAEVAGTAAEPLDVCDESCAVVAVRTCYQRAATVTVEPDRRFSHDPA